MNTTGRRVRAPAVASAAASSTPIPMRCPRRPAPAAPCRDGPRRPGGARRARSPAASRPRSPSARQAPALPTSLPGRLRRSLTPSTAYPEPAEAPPHPAGGPFIGGTRRLSRQTRLRGAARPASRWHGRDLPVRPARRGRSAPGQARSSVSVRRSRRSSGSRAVRMAAARRCPRTGPRSRRSGRAQRDAAGGDTTQEAHRLTVAGRRDGTWRVSGRCGRR